MVGLLQAAVVYVHLIGCAADHLTLSHQRLIGQQLRYGASVSHDGQRLLLRKVDFLHLRQKTLTRDSKQELESLQRKLGTRKRGSRRLSDDQLY